MHRQWHPADLGPTVALDQRSAAQRVLWREALRSSEPELSRES